MDIKGKMDRREFIKSASIAGLGLAAGPALLDLSAGKAPARAAVSKIVIAEHSEALTGIC